MCAGEGGIPGPRLDVTDHVQAEAIGEVRPGAVVRHDLEALVGGHQRVPALLGLGQPLVEVHVAGGEVGSVSGRHARELVRDRLRDVAAVAGVEVVVRVALRVHVTHRAGDLAGRDLEDPRGERGIEVALGARLDLRVAALVEQRRQPADLQLAADDDQQVGLRELEDEARLRLDEVRVLVAARDRLDLHLVAADLARQVGEVLGARHHVHGGAGGAAGRRHGDGGERGGSEKPHGGTSVRRDGRRGRRSRTGTGRGTRPPCSPPRRTCGGTARGSG